MERCIGVRRSFERQWSHDCFRNRKSAGLVLTIGGGTNPGCQLVTPRRRDLADRLVNLNPMSIFAKVMLALVRIAVGVIFFFFAQYKIAGSEFVHGGFEKYIRAYVDRREPVSWLYPVLTHYVLPHPVLWGRVVAWSELLIAISLILGLWVRASSIGGVLFMLALALTSWFGPGHGAPKWRYLGANLDHIPLLLLFLLFFAFNAGKTMGLDAVLPLRRH
jgi:uncharacterized membrane protein YphA (DoxX/SURF4 family)